MRPPDKEKERKTINWKALGGIFVFVIAVLGLIAYPPRIWLSSLGEWFTMFKSIAWILPVIAICVLLLLVFLLMQKLRNKSLIAVSASPSPFTSLIGARDILSNILSEFSKSPGIKEIKVLGTTGGSFLTIIKELLERRDQIKNVNFKLLLINPDFEEIDAAASHWKDEVNSVIKELADLNAQLGNSERKVSFEWRLYDYLPTVHGLKFDDQYLLIGFCHWVQKGDKCALKGAEKPYLSLKREDKNSHIFFDLFNSWFGYSWKEK